MNTFNRIVFVIVLLALIPLMTVLFVIPHVILSEVGAWATAVGRQLWAADVVVRLGIGVLLAIGFNILALLLVFLEVRPHRRRFIRVENLTGGMATIGIESVVRQLEYRLDPLPEVINVKPEIQAKRNNVQAIVHVDVTTGVNVPQMASRLVEEVKDVLVTELGLHIAGEPEVRINVMAPPAGRRAAPQRPLAPLAPFEPPILGRETKSRPDAEPGWRTDAEEPTV